MAILQFGCFAVLQWRWNSALLSPIPLFSYRSTFGQKWKALILFPHRISPSLSLLCLLFGHLPCSDCLFLDHALFPQLFLPLVALISFFFPLCHLPSSLSALLWAFAASSFSSFFFLSGENVDYCSTAKMTGHFGCHLSFLVLELLKPHRTDGKWTQLRNRLESYICWSFEALRDGDSCY